MIPKIFPRNLTARAAMRVAGNPDTTRLESGVGNCFPGLEFDHRNLDRRFFPGLVFEFTDGGAQLLKVDADDLDMADDVRSSLRGPLGQKLGKRGTKWFLSAATQFGKRIVLPKGSDVDLLVLHWRLVRCLEPGPVTIALERRERPSGAAEETVELLGRRREFVDSTTGVISRAYAAGELTQSLCSPWMHDFRDCACFYWASNHPDIVLAEDPPGVPELPSGAPDDPRLALTPIDWLRRDRASVAPAQASDDQNRQDQLDHFEINNRWQELAIVLRGREISNIYTPEAAEEANPFSSPDELADWLVQLARLEHTVALQYLYARYSLKDPAQAGNGSLGDVLTFVWHEILLIAVSEMRHLRWVNQLLWSMHHNGLIANRGPSLGVADQIPAPTGTRMPGGRGVVTVMRAPDLLPLTPEVLDAFIAIEEPSGFLDGQYSRVLSTLRQPLYGPTLEQLAARIIADGAEHFSRFREIQLALQPHEPQQYLQPDFKPAPVANRAASGALDIYRQILKELADAYRLGDMEDAAHIATARKLMFDLDGAARDLANNERLGIPFLAATAAPGGGG
jgi:hypothetical protein